MRAVIGGLALAAFAMGAVAAPSLASLGGHSRVLVVSAPGEGDPGLRAQRAGLGPVGDGLVEHDLIVIEAVGDSAGARALRARLGLPDAAFRAVLLGKDGGAKLTSATPIPPRALFATIDAMPVRRQEMRRQEMRRQEMRKDEMGRDEMRRRE